MMLPAQALAWALVGTSGAGSGYTPPSQPRERKKERATGKRVKDKRQGNKGKLETKTGKDRKKEKDQCILCVYLCM